jgi:hypothetical protein
VVKAVTGIENNKYSPIIANVNDVTISYMENVKVHPVKDLIQKLMDDETTTDRER